MKTPFRTLSPNSRRALAGTALTLAALALGGCVVAPLAPYGGGVAYNETVVPVAPPPARVEYYGVAPLPGQIWIGGYWGWNGGRHVWAPGYWQTPRPGYRWTPHRWEQAPGGWRERPGYWGRG